MTFGNNYVGNSIMLSKHAKKNFDILSNLNVLHYYFDSFKIIFRSVSRFLDTLAKRSFRAPIDYLRK